MLHFTTTDCTLPVEGSSFVSAPNTRGTLTILWSCLSTIILCTWNIQHLNVPVQTHAIGWKQKGLRKMYSFSVKMIWMTLSIMAPEYILGKAVLDLLSAQRSQKQMEPFTITDGREWSASHAFLANMGGFELVFNGSRGKTTVKNSASLADLTTHRDGEMEMGSQPHNLIPGTDIRINSLSDQAFRAPPLVDEATENLRAELQRFLHQRNRNFNSILRRYGRLSRLMGKVMWSMDVQNRNLICKVIANVKPGDIRGATLPWLENLLLLQGDRWCLNAPQLFFARRVGLLEKLPDVTEDDIDDRNKGDFLVKGIAILQIVWLVAQLLSRAAQNLPVSQLEILTFSYAVSAVLTYVTIFSKPQDVKTPFVIQAARNPTVEDLIQLANHSPSTFGNGRYKHTVPHRAVHPFGLGSPYVWNFAGSAAGAALFGGLHCLAWSFDFPTPVEQLLWRVAALVTIGVPVLSLLYNMFFWGFIAPCLRRLGSLPPGVLAYYSTAAFGVPYAIARVYVLVEVFRSLAFLPPFAYQATWTSNAPQIA